VQTHTPMTKLGVANALVKGAPSDIIIVPKVRI
jgi:hypothetical protein